jgi:Family of unknown function (DUF6055)
MWFRAGMLAVVAVLVGSAPAGAAPSARALPSRSAAELALAKVQQLQQGRGVETGRELTPALNQLFAGLPSLSPRDRRTAEAILARPDDGQPDPAGTHKWSGPEAGTSPKCTAHFCVHFTMSGPDASNGTYAQNMANLFENEVYPCENGTAPAACAGSPGLGWRDPSPDGGRGGDNRVDIYIEDLFTTERVFGYVALDPGQTQNPAAPHFAYMVMDKDYSRFATASLTALQAEEVTAAHEYNHVLQNAYDYLEDPWMFEATAVYMEDKVYPSINDYLNYVNSWVSYTRQPLTAFPSTNLKAYGSAVWNHWLDHRYGAGVVRGAWEQSVAQADFAPGAYNAAIGGAGGAGFADEFERFAATVAEWDAPGAGFPDPYPDVPRDGQLLADTQTQPFALPHTTFVFLDVPIPPSAPTIRLTGTLPTGVQGAIALVGRAGADPAAGTVTTNLTSMPAGGTAVVSLSNPGQFGRITAVVVNADPSRAGFDPQADDWVFTRDASGVVVSLAQPGAPIATTGAPGTLADHSATVNGGVDPHLIDTNWTVEYGPTTAYGSATAPQALPGSTVGAAAVTASLGALKANRTYHYRLVATNSAGISRGADMTFTTARDVTKPVVSFTVKRQKIRTVRTRGLRYLGRCSERCLGNAQLTVSRSVARELGTAAVLGKSRIVLDPKSRSTTLRIRVTKRSKKRLADVRKPFAAVVKIRVADESRNAVTVRRPVKLTP